MIGLQLISNQLILLLLSYAPTNSFLIVYNFYHLGDTVNYSVQIEYPTDVWNVCVYRPGDIHLLNK